MTSNPTARPFILGALLFFALVALWPAHARGAPPSPVAPSPALSPVAAAAAPAAPKTARCELVVNNRTPFRALIHLDGVYWGWVGAQQSFTFRGIPAGDPIGYATTQYAEYSWGPRTLRCAGQASWDLSF